jgi:hypothetical protein
MTLLKSAHERLGLNDEHKCNDCFTKYYLFSIEFIALKKSLSFDILRIEYRMP